MKRLYSAPFSNEKPLLVLHIVMKSPPKIIGELMKSPCLNLAGCEKAILDSWKDLTWP